MYGKHPTKETKRKLSLAKIGNTNGGGNKGKKRSKETVLKVSLSNLKCNPDYKYCDEWKDRQYRKDLRKNYCECADCKGNYKKLEDHHINLNKKDCRPFNIMTLCPRCHTTLHRELELGIKKAINHKDYLTIIRQNRITYFHKKTRMKIILKRVENGLQ